jgi:uncharacterized membrane protein YeaQ/YmgE (transglycosylase-associated protein family)
LAIEWNTWKRLPELRGPDANAPSGPRAVWRLVAVGKEATMHWVWLIIVGIVVGLLGRLVHRGRDPMGFFVTLIIGVAALVIAGLIFSAGWLQFVVGVIVAALLVELYERFAGARGARTA